MQKKIPFLIFLCTSFSNRNLGLGLIAPFVSLIINEEISKSLNKFFNIGIEANDWIFIFILILVGVFMLKTFLFNFLNFYLISFIENQRLKIKKSHGKYQNLPYQDYTNKKKALTIFIISVLLHLTMLVIHYFIFLKLSSDLVFVFAVSIFLMFQNIVTFAIMFFLFLSFLSFYNFFSKQTN